MSFDISGFDEKVVGTAVTIDISTNHKLIKLANNLPWEEMLAIVLPDLQRTERLIYWVGRPLKLRIHLAAYLLQQFYDLTDRAT